MALPVTPLLRFADGDLPAFLTLIGGMGMLTFFQLVKIPTTMPIGQVAIKLDLENQ
ncbi:hypothetical protein [Paradevosia shaoguanensis]|uniref:hypothetical protein n=1 Tax=Paradevosia shaoguanensis TaxID=1335043 RepID=UPI003C74797E